MHETRAIELPRERFLTRSMQVAFAAYALFAVTFSYFQVKGDGLIYFNLLRRFFGEHPDSAVAYQFGSDLWNAPFFLVGKLFSAIFGAEPRTFHVTFEEISITFASNAAFVATLYLGWRILRELDLPRNAAVLFLTAFGTPLFYYVVFEPGAKHAVDTLVLTATVYAYLRLDARPSWKTALAIGALVGWSLNIRFVNGAFFAVLGLALLTRRRWAAVALASVTAAAVGGAIFALPALRGIDYFRPSYFLTSGAVRIASGASLIVGDATGGTSNPFHAVRPSTPLKMLFSEHRGLFVWTPLAALAVLGFLLLIVESLRNRRQRTPYLALLLASAALVVVHIFWYQWDGGFAFSQRFLTGLFPIYLIGIAEVVRRLRFAAYPLLVAGVGFALFVAFVHNVGYDGVSERDGIGRVLQAGYDGRHTLRLRVQDDGKGRWHYLWSLLHGEDPKHVHG